MTDDPNDVLVTFVWPTPIGSSWSSEAVADLIGQTVVANVTDGDTLRRIGPLHVVDARLVHRDVHLTARQPGVPTGPWFDLDHATPDLTMEPTP